MAKQNSIIDNTSLRKNRKKPKVKASIILKKNSPEFICDICNSNVWHCRCKQEDITECPCCGSLYDKTCHVICECGHKHSRILRDDDLYYTDYEKCDRCNSK